ncbi:hypothetical protein ABZ281_47525, partial [Streptomyces sp. NPDC006265]
MSESADTSCLVAGQPRHIYLQAMAAMGMPRCGTQPTAPAAPVVPTATETAAPVPAAVGPAPAPQAVTAPPVATPARALPAAAPTSPVRPPAVARRPGTATSSAFRRKTAKKPAAKAVAPEHADGPLAVLDITDGALTAHLVDGRTMPCPARTLQALAAWALDKKKIRLGAAKLHDNG